MDAVTTTAAMVATAAAAGVTMAAEAVGQRTPFGKEDNQATTATTQQRDEVSKAIDYERTPSPRREPPRSPSAPAVSPGTPFSFFSPLFVPIAAATSSVMDARESAPGAAAMRESCSQQAPPTPVAAAIREASNLQQSPTTTSTPPMPPPHFPAEALPAQASSVLAALESAWSNGPDVCRCLGRCITVLVKHGTSVPWLRASERTGKSWLSSSRFTNSPTPFCSRALLFSRVEVPCLTNDDGQVIWKPGRRWRRSQWLGSPLAA